MASSNQLQPVRLKVKITTTTQPNTFSPSFLLHKYSYLLASLPLLLLITTPPWVPTLTTVDQHYATSFPTFVHVSPPTTTWSTTPPSHLIFPSFLHKMVLAAFIIFVYTFSVPTFHHPIIRSSNPYIIIFHPLIYMHFNLSVPRQYILFYSILFYIN